MAAGRPRLKLKGKRFGRWLVLSFAGLDKYRHTLWNCRCDCGTEKVLGSDAFRENRGTKSCGCWHREVSSKRAKSRIRDKNPNWKGGKTMSNGYVYLLARDHPKAYNGKIMLEHRLAAEEALGRYLETYEVIHHIDGDKANNSLSNLYLFPTQGRHLIFHNKKDSPVLTSNLLDLGKETE